MSKKTTVVIVESPAKCSTIESYLGAGYKCIASYGHITHLENLKDVDIENNFKPTFKIIEKKKKQINKIRELIKGSDEVIIATDDDREGEAIGWHICQVFDLPVSTTKRIIFHEVTETVVKTAIKTHTVINMNTVRAQQARQILDIMVGFKISPLLWAHISQNTKTGLSAGRCQTPALRIIYENQLDVNKSPGKMVYTTTGYFTQLNIPFVLTHQFVEKYEMKLFLEESKDFTYVYKCNSIRESIKYPPNPFTTSRIQQTVNTELRMSPKETMKLCQSLYEKGLITYMRTDSNIYSTEFLQTVKEYVELKWGDDYISENLFRMGSKNTVGNGKASTHTQDAHEAIRPTDINRSVLDKDGDFNHKERKLYALIWRNTVESCMSTAIYSGVTGCITAPQNKEYRYSTEQSVFPGWKVVGGFERENREFNFMRTLKSLKSHKKITSKVSMKEMKQHYTEAKLVQLLEEKGIGRPSTFASLIEKIQDRGYVKCDNIIGKKMSCVEYELLPSKLNEIEHDREFGNEKNKLVIQSVGIMVIEFLIKHYQHLFEYKYTENMENDLDKIAKNEMIWYNVCEKCLRDIESVSPVNTKKQIVIDTNHIYMVGKYGPIIKYTDPNDNEAVIFKNVRKDIDVGLLENGKYTLEDIVLCKDEKIIGLYKDEQVVIKKSKYGHYAQVGKINISLSSIDKDVIDITLIDIEKIMANKYKNIIRTITDEISLRKSKHGLYLYYKSPTHKVPEFISLKMFKEDAENCTVDAIIEYVLSNKKIYK